MSVNMPQKQRGSQKSMGTIGTAAGAIIGGYFGGPAGAMEGSQVGGAIGNGAGAMFGTKSNPQAVGGGVNTSGGGADNSGIAGGAMQVAGGLQGASGAMERRAGAEAPTDRGISNTSQGGSMQRRMQQQSNPSTDLQQAESALAYLPPEQQKAYAPTIMQARRMDRGYA